MELKGGKKKKALWSSLFGRQWVFKVFLCVCEFLKENLGTYWAKYSSNEKCSALCFLCSNCKTSTFCFAEWLMCFGSSFKKVWGRSSFALLSGRSNYKNFLSLAGWQPYIFSWKYFVKFVGQVQWNASSGTSVQVQHCWRAYMSRDDPSTWARGVPIAHCWSGCFVLQVIIGGSAACEPHLGPVCSAFKSCPRSTALLCQLLCWLIDLFIFFACK